MWADLCGGTCILRRDVDDGCLPQSSFILCLEIPRIMAAYAGKKYLCEAFIKIKTNKTQWKTGFR